MIPRNEMDRRKLVEISTENVELINIVGSAAGNAYEARRLIGELVEHEPAAALLWWSS